MGKDLNKGLLSIIIIIISMTRELTFIGVLMWTIGVSLTFTILNRKGIGISMLKNSNRRIVLGIGMTITVCSLIDEVSIIALVMFAIGFIWTVMTLENNLNK